MRAARLRAVVFDVGNTLLHLDYAFIAEVLGERGLAVTSLAIREAEYCAKGVLDREVTRRTGGGAERLVWPQGVERPSYFATVLAELGIPAEERAPLTEMLRAHHRTTNLWRVADADAPDVLATLRARGFTLGVVSNADGRVEDDLVRQGLREHFAAVIDSHVVGVEKPDPAIFRLALGQLGVAAERAVYVGDLFGIDVQGARAAGMTAVLVDPLGRYPGPVDCPRVSRLGELLDLLPERALA